MRVPSFLLLTLPAILAAQEDPDRPVAQTPALDAKGTAEKMVLPKGFRVEVIASEPDVVQPIAYTIDDRGRLWVLENTNYPNCPGEPKDKLLVFEDADGDGKFEKRSVFLDKLNFSSGLAVGFGGVWIGSPPNLLFVPDANGDAVPDGEPQIVLDGWGAEDTHETLNDFTWGPDGWLYGTQGIFTNSLVGKPGTSEAERVPLNGAVWRYHPTRKVFERWCEGVSNQWGIDWNDHGEAFFAACVVPHMWHGIEGAHYTRQAGSHFNPYVYGDIRTIAWGRYEKAGYCGAMFYLGGAFPAEWRDNFFFHDVHMNKLRCEVFSRDGSGFRSSRKTDFIASGDAWFRGLSPQYGPDGGVFISDWYDKVPCHQQRAFTDRSNGRLYKLVNDQVKPHVVNLGAATDAELVAMHQDPNDWYVRHARRILQERGPKPETTAALEKILVENPDDTRQLRALWTLHSQGALSEAAALKALSASSEWVRGWAVTCVSEQGKPADILLAAMVGMAEMDPSPSVRLRLAAAAQKLPPAGRWPLLAALSAHAEDEKDHNLPLMNWYAAEGSVVADPMGGVALLKTAKQSLLFEYIPRRIVALSGEDEAKAAPAMAAIAEMLGTAEPALRTRMLRGMLDAAKGRKRLPEPPTWAAAYAKLRAEADEGVRQQARELSLLFGSSAALAELRAILANGKAVTEARREALEALLAQRDPESLGSLLKLAGENGPLRGDALRALASYDDPRIPVLLTTAYPKLGPKEKSTALTTFVSRPVGIEALLAAIDAKKIPAKDLTAPLARIIQAAKREDFDRWLSVNFGSLQPSNAERQKEIERYRQFLGEDAILHANAKNGRAVFERTCSACHTIFSAGGKIGPELPGNFADVEYLLQNVLDPDAVIGRDYQQTFITTKDGKLVAGVVAGEDASTVTVKTLAETVAVSKDSIAKRELSQQSMMPAGLLGTLEEPEVRDLFLYLRQSKNP
ncbi:PVC-type heme-binding CxxCH protein [Haloferula sp. BvORR071]|uniref:PVC-type heme-binding CxxCH protein n=1 Tax=Haloferula sp. BvORR071 TaxID=1396141 RepID=UPI002240FAB7|nr:PVC-type heme-binding CxxCH protein [Haloferula sp. BvORR071]